MNPSIASSETLINSLRDEFPASKVLVLVVDVTDEQMIESAVEQTGQEFGSIDILLCFAGVVGCTHAVEMASSEWKKVLDINTTGSWFCAQAVGRYALDELHYDTFDRPMIFGSQKNDPAGQGREYSIHSFDFCSSGELPATTSRI